MKDYVFEVVDKSGRNIRLTKRQWTHITVTHSEMSSYLTDIQKSIEDPLRITSHKVGNLRKYYSYIKHRNHPEKYLRIIVKYLNNHGFVITAHFIKNIQ